MTIDDIKLSIYLNDTSEIYSILLTSCKLNYLDGVKYALKHKSLLIFSENSPLRFAILNNNLEIIKYLKILMEDKFILNEFLIQFAVEHEYVDIVYYFVDNCNVDISKISDDKIKNIIIGKIRKNKLLNIIK